MKNDQKDQLPVQGANRVVFAGVKDKQRIGPKLLLLAVSSSKCPVTF
jgi:hypothetical protein